MGFTCKKDQWINVAVIALSICFIVFANQLFDEYTVRSVTLSS